MKFETAGSPHIPAPSTVNWVMMQVLIALIPGIIAYVGFFGPGVLIQISIAVVSALGFEYAMLKLRDQPTQLHMADLTAPVTAVLFALCLPPLMPWWASVIGMFFAIVVAKHLYGGMGFNLFNPAMVGYVVILIAFPLEASRWLTPAPLATESLNLVDSFIAIMTGALPPSVTWDAITQATPLDMIRTGRTQDIMLSEIHHSPAFGQFGGVGWEWVAMFYALGGIYLMFRRIINWRVPAGLFGVLFAFSLPLYIVDPFVYPFPTEQLFLGSMMLGAFFIATDPVTCSTTPRGRLIFGGGVALITLAIRRWGGYPDGIAFAVLIMNMAAPLLDRYTKPRVFGK
jgi:electron transport complex protein RnfD